MLYSSLPLAICLHMVVYICQSYTLCLSHHPLPHLCRYVHFLCLCLHFCLTDRIICVIFLYSISSVQFSCSVVSDSLQPHECSTLGLPVHHQLLEFIQTHVHRVSDAIQPSYLLSSPSPPAPNPWWTACFHILAIVNNAMKNIRMHVSFWIQCFHILWISFC